MTEAVVLPESTGRKIVVVDDEPSMCAMVASMLEDAGYAPAVTTDPRTAVALVRREKPVLVLVDISMPYMDGYALLDALQADPATSGCPVMFITGNLAFSQRMQAFQRGVRDYVAKPFTAEKLLAKIARVLSESEAKVPS